MLEKKKCPVVIKCCLKGNVFIVSRCWAPDWCWTSAGSFNQCYSGGSNKLTETVTISIIGCCRSHRKDLTPSLGENQECFPEVTLNLDLKKQEFSSKEGRKVGKERAFQAKVTKCAITQRRNQT